MVRKQCTTIEEALKMPQAYLLIHGPVSMDSSGNSRARQSIFTGDGECLFTDGRIRSYWYATQNERDKFKRRGGLVLTP